MVFTNGRIYSSNTEAPWASAVAIGGDKIVFVGDVQGALAHAGPETQKFDLDGELVHGELWTSLCGG